MATSNDIIFHRRVQLLELAEELGNISKACRLMGISRTRYYEWKEISDPLRDRRVDAQGPPPSPATQRDPDPCRR